MAGNWPLGPLWRTAGRAEVLKPPSWGRGRYRIRHQHVASARAASRYHTEPVAYGDGGPPFRSRRGGSGGDFETLTATAPYACGCQADSSARTVNGS